MCRVCNGCVYPCSNLPVKDLRELVAWLKANPDKATFGTAGVGSPSHIGGVLFQNVTGTRFQFIPYRGTAPVVPDLVSGQIDMAILDPITSLPQHRAGKIRIIAVMGKKHGSGSQDIPLTDESGAPGVYTEPWQGIWAPKGTPKEIVTKLNKALSEALDDKTVKQRLGNLALRGFVVALQQFQDGAVSNPVQVVWARSFQKAIYLTD